MKRQPLMKQQAMGMKLAILHLHWDPSNLVELKQIVKNYCGIASA